MKSKIRIGIVEDHDMVREGFVRLLTDEPKFKLIFALSNGKDLLQQLTKEIPDVLLLDMQLPEIHGSTILELINAKYPTLKVVVISAYSDDDLVVKYVKQGAASFIPKYSSSQSLIKGIFSVHKDGFYFEEPTLKMLSRKASLPNLEKPLSQSERKVVAYLCSGSEIRDIAQETGYSITFVYNLRKRIFLKTGTSTVEQLKEYAERYKYFSE